MIRGAFLGAFLGVVLAGVLLSTSAGGAIRAPLGSGLLQILSSGTAGASIFVAGDSTGDEESEWVYQLAWQLGYRYPAYRINYYLWDEKRRSWPSVPLVILQGASGGPALDVWNMSVSGARENYALAYAEREIVQKRPDLMFVSYGLNDGAETARFRWGIQSLVESVAARAPDTEIVLIAQNPAVGNMYQQARASELELLASQEGLGFVNVYGTFAARGDPTAYLTPDGLHPNAAGVSLWLNAVLVQMNFAGGGAGSAPAAGAVRAPSVIRNGDFSRFSGPSPTGWKLTNTRADKDFVQVEPSGHRYALRLTEVAPAGAYIYQPLDIKQVKGRWVTVAVRLMVPDGASNSSAGGAGVIDDHTDAAQSVQQAYGPRGTYYWEIVSRKIDESATTAGVVVYVDSAGVQSAGGRSTITVGQVLAVLGTQAPLGNGEAPAPPPPPRALAE